MYCIFVAGMPAAGKSTMAEMIAGRMKLPVLSKDAIKERLYDEVGFQSREEKVKLGTASMEIMYYIAGQLMGAAQPFILENNFEHSSEPGLRALLSKSVSCTYHFADWRSQSGLPTFFGAGYGHGQAQGAYRKRLLSGKGRGRLFGEKDGGALL